MTEIWRGLTQGALDRAYNNRLAVPDFERHLADWAARGPAFRARARVVDDVAYGPAPGDRLDLYLPQRARPPVAMFLHGGYWQMNDRRTFAHVAEGLVARGLAVAMVGYDVAPAGTMTRMCDQIRAAGRFLAAEGASLGVDPARVVACGHSAGGHLAAIALETWPAVKAAVAISGLFELEPIRLSYLNEKLALTAAEAAACSPALRLPAASGPLWLAVGMDELPELIRHSQDMAFRWLGAGLPGGCLPLWGRDHFTVLDDLSDPAGPLAARIAALAEGVA